MTMTTAPLDCWDTASYLEAVRYQLARNIMVGRDKSTTIHDDEVRTVVTTAMTGGLDLRYVPRRPKILRKTTAL